MPAFPSNCGMKAPLIVFALALGVLANEAPALPGLDLAGRVIVPDDKPARVTVLILSTEPKPGLEYRVAARPPTVSMRTQTDGRGEFKIGSLDPAWRYRVLIVAPGYVPQLLADIDPAAGPLTVRLEPVDPAKARPDTVLHGRVMDARGHPVAGALVRIQGVTRNGMMRLPADNIDPFSISDEAGNFTVHGRTPFTAAEGAVEAAGFATGLFEGWTPGAAIHALTLVDGAALQGRVLLAGRPVAEVDVRLDNFGADSGSEAWHYSALTDDRGRFLFTHLPPNRSCTIYGTMVSLGDRGAIPKHRVPVGENGSTNDIGDLHLGPAFKIQGRIRLSDGKPIPPNSQLVLSRANMVNMQDSLRLRLGPDGSFVFDGVPPEPVQLRLRIPGYQLTPRDRWLIAGSAMNFTVTTSITNMMIEMKPAHF